MRPSSTAIRPKVDVPSPRAMKAGPRIVLTVTTVLRANEGEGLVAMLFHEFLRVALDVEAQERLGIRGAHVHPPVRVGDRDAVEMIDAGIAIVRFDLAQLCRSVFDLGVDFSGAKTRVDRGDRLAHRRARFAKEFEAL